HKIMEMFCLMFLLLIHIFNFLNGFLYIKRKHFYLSRWRCVAFAVALVMFLRTASAQIRYSISEEVKEGTVVGNIARDLGIDKGVLKERHYRIVGGSSEPLFHLNPDTGFLSVARRVDREEICEHGHACTINLKTVLENPLEIHYVSIEVLDVNDNSPVFPDKENENAAFGTRVVQVNATDSDEGANGEIVYSFGKEVDVNVQKLFFVDSKTGVITVAATLVSVFNTHTNTHTHTRSHTGTHTDAYEHRHVCKDKQKYCSIFNYLYFA
uniref:Protocadherin 2 alpha a 15 n=1 Tax=Gouania willdenowi TaxID=441366 RepID=A0A8C5DMH7_GOUWI